MEKGSAIDIFVEQYKLEFDNYAKIAEAVRVRIKKLLDANGIMAIVSARAKSPDRLKGKLERMEREAGTPYESPEQIRDAIHDLVGARIALYFPTDGAKVGNLLQLDFDFVKNSKVFPPRVPGYEELVAQGCTAHKRKIYPGYDSRRFDGYHATHHYIRLRTPLIPQAHNPEIEVQVASVLMHAWSEVEHDLAYKKMTGNVSREEYECLDEINGLVIAGEIALNRLSRMSRQRIRMLTEFDSPYSLKLYLTDWLDQKKGSLATSAEDEDMTNIKQLFEMYREAEVLTPADLEARLRRLGKDLPASITPLVRLLIDQFYDENRLKAKQVTVDNILQYLEDDEAFFTGAKVGLYLGKWNALEDLVRRAVRTLGHKCSNSTMSWKLVVEEGVLPPEIAQTYRALRIQRNTIVHTNRLPGEETFRQLLQEMDKLSTRLKREYDLK